MEPLLSMTRIVCDMEDGVGNAAFFRRSQWPHRKFKFKFKFKPQRAAAPPLFLHTVTHKQTRSEYTQVKSSQHINKTDNLKNAFHIP